MKLVDTTEIPASFATIYVEFVEGMGFPDRPASGCVGAGPGGLVLDSAHSDHHPRIVIEERDQSSGEVVWNGTTALFDQIMDVSGPTIRVYDLEFIKIVEAEWTRVVKRRVRVFRTGEAELNHMDTVDVWDAVGVEQWLILLTEVES